DGTLIKLAHTTFAPPFASLLGPENAPPVNDSPELSHATTAIQQGLIFDGDAALTIPNSDMLSPMPFTVETWLRADGTQADHAGIFGQYLKQSYPTADFQGYALHFGGDGQHVVATV